MGRTMDMDRTCENIKELCSMKGITAEHLASDLNISKQAVYAWFAARKMPTVDHIVELSDILGVPIDEMIARTEYDCA